MCRKIGCNRNFRNRVNKTEFGRIVLNLIFYFGSKTKTKIVDITFLGVIILFLKIVLHLEFTLNLSTISVGSFNIRASREVFPTEVRSPEFGILACDELSRVDCGFWIYGIAMLYQFLMGRTPEFKNQIFPMGYIGMMLILKKFSENHQC
jgi:hypothetical protein